MTELVIPNLDPTLRHRASPAQTSIPSESKEHEKLLLLFIEPIELRVIPRIAQCSRAQLTTRDVRFFECGTLSLGGQFCPSE